MKYLRQLLILLVIAEVIAGAVAFGRKLFRPKAPLADLACVDSLTAADLQFQASRAYSVEDWRSLGEVYMATGFFREAEACHRVAASYNRDDAKLAWQWGFALERVGAITAANDEYGLAGRLDPDLNPACQYAIARNLLRSDKLEEANKCLERSGNLAAARYERARIAYRAGDLTTAASLATELIEELPAAQEPRRLLYKIALRQENSATLGRSLRDQYAASQLLPTPMDDELLRLRARARHVGLVGLRTAAQSEFEAGRFADAEEHLKQILSAQFDVTAADLMAEVEFYQGRQRDCARSIQGILDQSGPAIERLERLGDTNDALGLKNKAQSAWLAATQLAFGAPTRGAHRKLALRYESTGDTRLAKRHFALEALASGVIELQTGNAAMANTALQASTAADPELAPAWFYAGEAAARAGDIDEARRAYARCLAICPQHGRAADRLAELMD